MPNRAHAPRPYTGLALAAFALAAIPAEVRAQTIDEKAVVCGGCHGEDGVPQDKMTPVIWGQHAGYAYLQLRDYKRGDRKNEAMEAVVADMSRDDMIALAEYFAAKRWPSLRQPPASDAAAARAQRANVSVGCTGCHLGEYQGTGTQPRLAGQTKEYMLQTMLDFRTRKRGNNPGMSDLMIATPEEDITALAEYLAGM